MEELLYIWAKEYPEYKYQQGMNEILAVIIVCLFSELLSEESDTSKIKSSSEEGHVSDDCEDHDLDEAHKIFKELHDPNFIWADIYTMYENLMNLGVKELYYKDNTTNKVKY